MHHLARMRAALASMKLEEVDRKKRDVKKEHRINMSEQAVGNE
jgi:hypothetical protein